MPARGARTGRTVRQQEESLRIMQVTRPARKRAVDYLTSGYLTT